MPKSSPNEVLLNLLIRMLVVFGILDKGLLAVLAVVPFRLLRLDGVRAGHV